MKSLLKIVCLILIVAPVFYGCSSDAEKKVSYYKKGVGYFDKQEYKAAEIELKNAIQIDSKYVAAYSKLAKKEETAMIDQFGFEYLEYEKSVPAFFPHIVWKSKGERAFGHSPQNLRNQE